MKFYRGLQKINKSVPKYKINISLLLQNMEISVEKYEIIFYSA